MRNIVLESSSPNNSRTFWQLGNRANRGIVDMRIKPAAIRLGLVLSLTATGCTTNKVVPATGSHADHGTPSSSTAVVSVSNDPRLPPDASGALARLSASPRHGEWVT